MERSSEGSTCATLVCVCVWKALIRGFLNVFAVTCAYLGYGITCSTSVCGIINVGMAEWLFGVYVLESFRILLINRMLQSNSKYMEVYI